MQGHPVAGVIMGNGPERRRLTARSSVSSSSSRTAASTGDSSVLEPAARKFPQAAPHVVVLPLLDKDPAVMFDDRTGHDNIDLFLLSRRSPAAPQRCRPAAPAQCD